MKNLKFKVILILIFSWIFLCGFSFKTEEKEIVIFVHGVMGNSFTNGEHRIWPPRVYGESGIKAILDTPKVFSDIKYLAFSDEGKPLYNLTIMPESKENVIFNEYYKNLREAINKTNKYKFFYFPYDWRYSCDYNGDKLKTVIEGLKNKGHNKISIIGYSMGGIVTLNALEKIDKGLINKIITLSTPYLGSPKSIYATSTGMVGTEIGHRIMSLKLNSMIKNFPSAYELFPTQGYKPCYIETIKARETNNLISQNDIDKFFINGRFINSQLYDKYSPLKVNRISSLLNQMQKNKYYLIVGSGIGTVGKLQFKRDILSDRYRFHDFELIDGDGDVPNDSLNVNNLIAKENILYTNVSHQNICKNSYVINRIIDILDDKPIDYMRGGDLRSAEEGQIITREALKARKIKVTVEGDGHDKFRVHLYDSNNNHSGFVKEGIYEKKISYSNVFLNEESVIMSVIEGNYSLKIDSDNNTKINIKVTWYDEDNNKVLEKEVNNLI